MAPKATEIGIKLPAPIREFQSRYNYSVLNNLGSPMFSTESSQERKTRVCRHITNTRHLLERLLEDLEWVRTISDELGV